MARQVWILEPGGGIEPTSVIRLLDVYCGLLRAVLLSAARRLKPFGLRWKSSTKASPTPALRSLAPGNFDGSGAVSYKASRKNRTHSFIPRQGHLSRGSKVAYWAIRN